MNVRIKFSKYGLLKYVGHLDIMRYFQKAVRRAGIDITYSKGFSPHPVMSFAMPLSLGATSDGEYMDMELNSCGEEKDMLLSLNNVMTEGVNVTKFIKLPDWELNKKRITAMSMVAAADYKVSFKRKDIIRADEFHKEFTSFMNKESIMMLKRTKKGEMDIDLKPYIYSYAYTSGEFAEKNNMTILQVKNSEKTAVEYDSTAVYLRLSAGSLMNIKPEVVIEAFFKHIEGCLLEHAIQVHRMELYKKNETEIINYIPLYEV